MNARVARREVPEGDEGGCASALLRRSGAPQRRARCRQAEAGGPTAIRPWGSTAHWLLSSEVCFGAVRKLQFCWTC